MSLRVILMNILGLCFKECSIADKPMFIFVLGCGVGHFNFLWIGRTSAFIEKIIATLVSSLTLYVPSTVKSKLEV